MALNRCLSDRINTTLHRLGCGRLPSTNKDFFCFDRNNKEQWSGFISKYLSGSDNLGLVCQLIDIRHKPMESDLECYQWLKDCGLRVQIVLTKSDKLSKNAAMSQKALFKREMGLSEDDIITYTSSQHTNRGELINRIMAALVDNGVEEQIGRAHV